jgi:putative transposase
MPVESRKVWVDPNGPLALTRQCELAGVARSGIYAPHVVSAPDEQELRLLAEIDAEYTRHPFYGSRKMVVYLRGKGHSINRKRLNA